MHGGVVQVGPASGVAPELLPELPPLDEPPLLEPEEPDDEDEPEEDDEEDDEEDEEDETEAPDLSEMDRAELKAYIKDNNVDIGGKVKKKWSDDELREKIEEAIGSDDEEEAEEPEPAPARKTSAGKTKAKTSAPSETKKAPGRPRGSGKNPPRDPKDVSGAQLTPDDIAHIAGVPEHKVRNFARQHPKAFPKASPKAQYRFNVKQTRVLLKGLGALAE